MAPAWARTRSSQPGARTIWRLFGQPTASPIIRKRPKSKHVGSTVVDLSKGTLAFVAKATYVTKQFSTNNRSSEQEYKDVMETIRKLVAEHKTSLVPGEPQFNFCDDAVMVSCVSRQLKSFKVFRFSSLRARLRLHTGCFTMNGNEKQELAKSKQHETNRKQTEIE